MLVRSCLFKITDGLVSTTDQENHDRKCLKVAYVPIEINANLRIKRSIEILDGIDGEYKGTGKMSRFYFYFVNVTIPTKDSMKLRECP